MIQCFYFILVLLQTLWSSTVIIWSIACTYNRNFIVRPLLRRSIFYHYHDDVIKWKHFPRFWPFVRGIHRSPVNSPHRGQWRGALMFSLICAWIQGWVNNCEAGDLRRHRAHYDVIVMIILIWMACYCCAVLCFMYHYGLLFSHKMSCCSVPILLPGTYLVLHSHFLHFQQIFHVQFL